MPLKIFFIAAILILPFAGNCATYTVTNTNDSGSGSLRQAITGANAAFGTDVIEFNIPLTDINYNSATGVWTIAPASDLPMITSGYVFLDATTQTANRGNTNLLGPEIAIDGSNSLTYAFMIVSSGNSVKGFIIGRCEFGIQVYGTLATGNVITGNFIGAGASGAAPFSNDYGIGISGDAPDLVISNNIISGNAITGIGASPANHALITGNRIGTDASGMLPLPNAIGIILDNSPSNSIGGNTIADRNIISGNTDGGILINGTASSGNVILGNYIGVNALCTDSIPNGNGIMIISAPFTTVGGTTVAARNVISSNTQCGILLNGTGANNNVITGNHIGVDSSGTVAMSNHYGVIIKADADRNRVGSSVAGERNVISANLEIGVYIEASDSNVISGNYIGTDYAGASAFSNGVSLVQANGVEVNTLSKHNIIGGATEGERNIISGNRVYGAIYYGQSSHNSITGNYIGTDVSGTYAIPNATGICLDDASASNTMENNLLSGNISYGAFIVTTGSNNNIFRGNLVGTNAAGTDTIPNDIGLLLAGGAKNNIIGGDDPSDRNVFSANRYSGIAVTDNGTKYNNITGNYVGTDISGQQALPNGIGVVSANNARGTVFDGNVISGNAVLGMAFTDNTDSNLLINNIIGAAADAFSPLGNRSIGILFAQGAKNNTVGIIGQGNIIAYNDSGGVILTDHNTINNRLSGNSFFLNRFLGIDIFPFSVNENDSADTDEGPNRRMNFPVIVTSKHNTATGLTVVRGTIETQNPRLVAIEIYEAAPVPLLNYGEGKSYVCSAVPDDSGNWAAMTEGLAIGKIITATATDADGNTSEFSLNQYTVAGFDTITGIAGLDAISMFRASPNPSPGEVAISYFLTGSGFVQMNVFDLSGKKISSLIEENQSPGNHFYKWNGGDDNHNEVASGLYFIEINFENERQDVIRLGVIR